MTLLTVDDLARDLKVKNEDLVRELLTLGFEVNGPESPLETEDPDALMAKLTTVLPRREVIEKRIKPTVIRRRVKKKPAAVVAAKEEPPSEELSEEAPSEIQAQPPSEPEHAPGTEVTEMPATAAKTEETLKPPAKKAGKKGKKIQAARIIEKAPPAPEMIAPPATAEIPDETTPAPPSSTAVTPVKEGAAEPPPPHDVSLEAAPPPEAEAAAIAATSSTSAEADGATPPGGPPEKTAAGEPGEQEEGVAATAEAKAESPMEEAEAETPDGTKAAEAEKKTADAKLGKKKKKKEKKIQPAQIIGKVDLKKEPEKEPERPQRPARPARPAPSASTPGPPQRAEAPHARPMAPPATPGPGTMPLAAEGDDERRRRKKKDKQRSRETGEDLKGEDTGKVRRRKEVLLRDDLYDERTRLGRRKGKGKKTKQRKTEITMPKASKRRIKIAEVTSVSNLAHKMSVKATEVIQHLFTLGVTATMNETVDYDTASIVASEFGFEAESAEHTEKDLMPDAAIETSEDLVARPPVITMMGHVDHGKTSLLDFIRQTHVTDHEAGGITQHIGAYKVKLDKGEVVFLDTPGHEAFTAMRARGAHVTDFVVLVVAADDGVMDQTREAINHARAASVPIVVAVNKIDKPEADRDRVVRELSELELIPESWGGDTLFAFVSAKTGDGIPDLLDLLLLQAEIMELKANPKKAATGTVVEARLDKGRGPVATVLVKEGTLKLSDAFVAGVHHGKVRAMIDHEGRRVEEAGPATPVEIQGFSGVPEAGELFVAVGEEKVAKQIGTVRQQKERAKEAMAPAGPRSLDELLAQMHEQEGAKEVNLILKGDVQGSVEALQESLLGLSAEEVKVKVIHSGVGTVTESDVMLASASDAMIIGFNVRPAPKTMQLAEEKSTDIRFYTVIYEAIEDVRQAMEGLLEPVEKENIVGHAEVRQTFSVSRVGAIAGCYVTSGKIHRSDFVRVIRDGVLVYDGKINSMKRYKDDIKEAAEGYECGLALHNFQDVKIGDVVEAYTIEQESAKLSQ